MDGLSVGMKACSLPGDQDVFNGAYKQLKIPGQERLILLTHARPRGQIHWGRHC